MTTPVLGMRTSSSESTSLSSRSLRTFSISVWRRRWKWRRQIGYSASAAAKTSAAGKGHRQIFSRNCDGVVNDMGNGDVRTGALQLIDTNFWLQPQPLAERKSQVLQGGR